ncbi:hypothetical protein BD770DRAFT_449214 [Pilaira anomala]|nr:hypothetical protein BD770DRAFT_449214 [Pilaira anomala]
MQQPIENQISMTLTNAVIVPTTAVYAVEPDPDDPNSDPVISIMAWIEYPRSIISLRMKESLILRNCPDFFRSTRHEGRRINCTGDVSYMLIHGLNIPAVDARFSLGVFEIEFLPGIVPINGHFQTFLRIHEGPLHTTRGTHGEGYTILNFRTFVTSFTRDADQPTAETSTAGSQDRPQAPPATGSQAQPATGSQARPVTGSQAQPEEEFGTSTQERPPTAEEDVILGDEEEAEVQQDPPEEQHQGREVQQDAPEDEAVNLYDISEAEDDDDDDDDDGEAMDATVEADKEVERVANAERRQKRKSEGEEPPTSALRRLEISSQSSQGSENRVKVTRSSSLLSTQSETAEEGTSVSTNSSEREESVPPAWTSRGFRRLPRVARRIYSSAEPAGPSETPAAPTPSTPPLRRSTRKEVMNYIEDRVAKDTGILVVGLMTSPNYDEVLKNVFFNGKRELFWELAVKHDIIPTDDMDDLVNTYFFSFLYVVNEAHQTFQQVPSEEVEEGIQKIKDFIKDNKPGTVILVGKVIALHWWGRPMLPTGPIKYGEGDEMVEMYLLPGVVPNPSYSKRAIDQEFKLCAQWLLE